MKRIWKLVAPLFTLALILAGCAADYKTYSGSDRTSSQFAHVMNGGSFNPFHWGEKGFIFTGINGQEKVAKSYYVLPGRHTVGIMLDGSEATRLSVTFEARAGRSYEVKALNKGVGAFGVGGDMHVWVQDVETKEVVGGRRPTQD